MNKGKENISFGTVTIEIEAPGLEEINRRIFNIRRDLDEIVSHLHQIHGLQKKISGKE